MRYRPAEVDQGTLEISKPVAGKLREQLPSVALSTAEAVIAEVPGYGDLRGLEGASLDQAVELALRGFLSVASESGNEEAAYPLRPALDAAYALGRGEVRSGRTMDVLLSAYRVGAKVAWREWSRVAIEAGVGSDWLARFAELTFSYIDELSAASVSGYAEEMASREQTQRRRLENFTRGLLAGGPVEALQAEADRAGWRPPVTITAILMPATRARGIQSLRRRRLARTDRRPARAGQRPGHRRSAGADDRQLRPRPSQGHPRRTRCDRRPRETMVRCRGSPTREPSRSSTSQGMSAATLRSTPTTTSSIW